LGSLLKISVSVLFFILSLQASGDGLYHLSTGAGEAGMGYICIMRSGFWTSFQNQATLAKNNSFSTGFNYQNRFGIKELGTRSAALIIPAGKASAGAIYSHFGYADFKRDMAGLACGIKLSQEISAGVQIDYFSERSLGEYNNHQSVTFETGILITPSEKTMFGFHLFNPVPGSIRKSFMPTILRIGAGTELSDALFAGIEAEMSTLKKLSLRAGFEYEASRNFWLRGGYCTEFTSFSFGLGYLTKIARMDFGFNTHERLGISSSVSIIFKIR
jgi:hypothetical protein